jgi:hypothetical protein
MRYTALTLAPALTAGWRPLHTGAVQLPLCRRHHPDFLRFWSTLVFPGIPAEIHVCNAYDEDA